MGLNTAWREFIARLSKLEYLAWYALEYCHGRREHQLPIVEEMMEDDFNVEKVNEFVAKSSRKYLRVIGCQI